MRFLEDLRVYTTDFGLAVEVVLGEGWEDAAKRAAEKFKDGAGMIIFQPEVDIANSFLRELEQKAELGFGESGLHHIHLIPVRAGLDLFPSQNSYISHNLSRPHQVAAVLVIINRYLKDLEYLRTG